MRNAEIFQDAVRRMEAAALPDPRSDAWLLLTGVLGRPRSSLLLREEMPEDARARFEALLQRRLSPEPVQYLLGSAWFMGLEFFVDPRVLIPRQDTEALCEEALFHAARLAERRGEPIRILDLCTGSGALAVTLRLRTGAETHASDISPDALLVAEENARRLGADVRFHQGDLFGAVSGLAFDLIVCNPPYIPEGERESLQPEVRKEPEIALFGGEDGLSLYRRIVRGAPAALRPGGVLLLEVGQGQMDRVLGLLRAAGLAGLGETKDLNGVRRVATGRRADAD